MFWPQQWLSAAFTRIRKQESAAVAVVDAAAAVQLVTAAIRPTPEWKERVDDDLTAERNADPVLICDP